jgi:hypothetical protein
MFAPFAREQAPQECPYDTMGVCSNRSERRWTIFGGYSTTWDFIGVRGLSAHDDEYDCILGPLLTRLAADAEVDEIAAYLRQRIEAHFGVDPDCVDIDDFAGRAVMWWRSGSTTDHP